MKTKPPFQFADKTFEIGEGTSNLGKIRSYELTLGQLAAKLRSVVRDNVSHATYLRLPKEEQDRRKNHGFWLGGPSLDGKRRNLSLRHRSTLTLDCDAGTPELFAKLKAGKTRLNRYSFLLHTTRKHTPDAPRFRVVVPTVEACSIDQYAAQSRIAASYLDPSMDAIDDVSFRPAQMMFWPTVSADAEFIFFQNEGHLFDGEAILDDFGDWRDFTKLPYSERQGQKRPTDPSRKAENPLEKRGLVGAFCRSYGIEDAIDKFLPGVYVPGDAHSNKPRWTFVGGSTTNGAVIEDGGLFLYSHHTSDPCTDRLVNSFDLVRIHLFGTQDDGKDPFETKPVDMPSFKAMEDLLGDDAPTIRELQAERYDAVAMFDDLGHDPDAPVIRPRVAAPAVAPAAEPSVIDAFADLDADEGYDADVLELLGPPPAAATPAAPAKPVYDSSWMEKLEITEKGTIKSNLPNEATILQHDPRLHKIVELNEFTVEIVTRRPLRSRMEIIPEVTIRDPENGDQWSDFHDTAVRMLLEAPNGKNQPGYGLKVSDRDLEGAVTATAMKNRFHPVREYLEKCADEWDRGSRVPTLFSKYLGAPESPYTRSVATIFCAAAVTRIFEPGHKFDFVVILEGVQGKRKSTFINVMARGWFAELEGDFNDRRRLVEQMQGAWILEIPELSGFSRADILGIKAFCSARSDKVRLAYARRAIDFQRQCVFMGSTNEREYLNDMTGGRRFWPVLCEIDGEIDTDTLAAEINQIWGEAVHIYREMRRAKPRGFLPLYLTDDAAKAEALEKQESRRVETEVDGLAGMIAKWLDTPATVARLEGVEARFEDLDATGDEPTALRDAACLLEIWEDCLANDVRHYKRMDAINLSKAMRLVGGWKADDKATRTKRFGSQKLWRRMK